MRSDSESGAAASSTVRGSFSEAVENVSDTTGPYYAPNEGSCFKENMNVNKFETPKLAMEPLQMKKKRKGGGFNLRKSLAWDRAFFTEEGVLDPQELSVISGSSCREGLPFVNEHTPVDLRLPKKPIDMQKLKNNIYRKLQDEDLAKDTKKDGSSLRLDSSSYSIASTSMTSHKVPTLVGCNKTGSSCSGIPRPLSSSSLKRPANANVGRAAGKELKLLKVPDSKPGLGPICPTPKKTISRANHINHNQVTQPGLKSSCESLKITQSASKSLQSALDSDGKSGNSPYRRHSSVSMSPVLVDKADYSGSNVVAPVRPVHASDGRRELETSAVPLSRDSHFSGRYMHPSQNQLLKPSGLRMPSPSLSFFSQTISSAFCNVPLKGTGTDVCGFQRHENCRLEENAITPKVDNKIQQIHGKAISSSSVYTASPHASAVTSIKPTMEQAPMLKIQDCSKKNRIEKISDKEAELWSIDNEAPSQSESQEQVRNESVLKGDGHPEESESCESGWKNPELRSEQKHAVQESKMILATDQSSKEKITCNLLSLNHSAILAAQCEDPLDCRVQESLIYQMDGNDGCKLDSLRPHRGNADSFIYPLGETDQDMNCSKLRRSEQLGVVQQNGGWCSRSGSPEALEYRMISKSENSCFWPKGLHAKEASLSGVLTENLLSGQSHIQDAVCNSDIGVCNNGINFMSEVGDDTKQPGEGSLVKNNCPEAGMKLQVNVELNTSGRLPHKQTCLSKCPEEQNFEKIFLFSDRKDGSKVGDTKIVSSLSLGERHDCIFDKEKIVGQMVSSVDSDSVDDSMSPERHKNVINNTFDCTEKHEGDFNYMLADPANNNLLKTLHEGSQRAEIDYISLSPISRTHEVSNENILGKVADMGSSIQVGSTNNQLTVSVSLNGNESDIDSFRYAAGSGTELLQSPESSMLNECYSQPLDHMTLPHAEFGVENLEHDHVGLHFENCLQTKSPSNEHHKDTELGSKEDSVTKQSKINAIICKSPSIPGGESPLKHGSCNDAPRTCNEPHSGDSPTVSRRVCPLSDTAIADASESNNFSSCIYPTLDAVKVEAALVPVNMHGGGCNEKSSSSVLSQSAIPFSDEWFAAIEAAGEDILTRKGGAVQNSPPDKPLPDPSPWSPVKKRNNQIGPFDCTKFTNNLPSDSS